MCRPVKCQSCGKTTWAGCGQHVEQVKASVPANQWCTCGSNSSSSTASTPANATGFFSKLFG